MIELLWLGIGVAGGLIIGYLVSDRIHLSKKIKELKEEAKK